MKAAYDITGQLYIPFRDEAELIETANAIIQKYLRVSDDLHKYYSYCRDKTPKGIQSPGLHPMMQKYYKMRDRVKNIANMMLASLGLECEDFFETEKMSRRYSDEGNGKEAHKLMPILNAFGYIQQEHDSIVKGKDAPSVCGYWYWLFEDPITSVKVPKVVLNQYIEKYES